MSRVLAVLAFVLAGVIAVAGVVAAAAAPHDAALHVSLAHGRPNIEHAASYGPDERIAVRVDGAKQAHAVSLVGVSPDGSNLRVPLSRRPEGSYIGVISLPTPGIWTLAIASEGAAASTASFAVAVVQQSTAEGAVTCAIIALLCVAAGVALIVYGLQRRRHPLA